MKIQFRNRTFSFRLWIRNRTLAYDAPEEHNTKPIIEHRGAVTIH